MEEKDIKLVISNLHTGTILTDSKLHSEVDIKTESDIDIKNEDFDYDNQSSGASLEEKLDFPYIDDCKDEICSFKTSNFVWEDKRKGHSIKGAKFENNEETHQCDEIFHQKLQVTAHHENVHVGELSSQYDGSGNSSIVHSDDFLYDRSLSDKTFSLKYDNITHQKFHSEEESLGMNNLTKKINEKNELPFLRIILKDVCGKVPIQSDHKKRRRALSDEKQIFNCEVCNKTFNQRHQLKNHTKIHAGDEPFNCEVCDKSFSQKNILNQHKMLHMGKNPFSCE